MPILPQGMLQQTPATLNTIRTGRKADGTMGTTRTPRRRKRKTPKASGKRRASKRKKTAAPKKGSPAMKRKMARLRRMRKK